MRFATRFDRGLTLMLILIAGFTCVAMPAIFMFAPKLRATPPPLIFLLWAIWATVLISTLPQYYEVREDCLFLRQGWRRISIPWLELAELQTMSDARSAGVFSTDRILVVTREGREYLIAVAEEQRFLNEVAMRAGQLERKSFGLGLPLASPTMI